MSVRFPSACHWEMNQVLNSCQVFLKREYNLRDMCSRGLPEEEKEGRPTPYHLCHWQVGSNEPKFFICTWWLNRFCGRPSTSGGKRGVGWELILSSGSRGEMVCLHTEHPLDEKGARMRRKWNKLNEIVKGKGKSPSSASRQPRGSLLQR